uniref:Uncharacterized protein n=1 Tax=Opuntia streptacantha TaxID=393608 RepID=A0A7C9A0G2_OPUST
MFELDGKLISALICTLQLPFPKESSPSPNKAHLILPHFETVGSDLYSLKNLEHYSQCHQDDQREFPDILCDLPRLFHLKWTYLIISAQMGLLSTAHSFKHM